MTKLYNSTNNSTDEALLLCLKDIKKFMKFGLDVYTNCNYCNLESIKVLLISNNKNDLTMTTYCSKNCINKYITTYAKNYIYEIIKCKSYEDIVNKQQEIKNACEKLNKIGLLL